MWFISCGESLGESMRILSRATTALCVQRKATTWHGQQTDQDHLCSTQISQLQGKKQNLPQENVLAFGPVWILVSPRQMHDWARQVQVIPSPKSLTPGFTGAKWCEICIDMRDTRMLRVLRWWLLCVPTRWGVPRVQMFGGFGAGFIQLVKAL